MPFVDLSPLTYPPHTTLPVKRYTDTRDPTTEDYRQFNIFDQWLNSSTFNLWIMGDKTASSGFWILVGNSSGDIDTLSDNAGTTVGASASGNIQLAGDNTSGINSVSTPASNLITFFGIQASESQRGTVELATGAETTTGSSTSLAVHPSGLNTKLGTQTANGIIFGTGGAGFNLGVTAGLTDGQLGIGNTAGTVQAGNITSTTLTIGYSDPDITIETGGVIATQYDTDSGSAVPALGILEVLGSHNVNTTGSGNTVTVLGDNAITLGDLSAIAAGSNAIDCDTGDINIDAGSLKLPTTSNSTTGVIFQNSSRLLHSFGTRCTFLGSGAGNFTAPSSTDCVGIGVATLDSLTSGDFNVCLGNSAGTALTSGGQNCAIGQGALIACSTASSNTSIGTNTLFTCTGGTNTAVGANAGDSITSGTGNIFLGFNGGGSCTTTDSNNIIIGNVGTSGDNARIRIGTNGTHTTNFQAGIAGVTPGGTNELVTVDTSTDQLGGLTYATGTFTPTLAFGGGSTGITYSNQQGRYQRVGDTVHFAIELEITSKGSDTGSATIQTLPFAAAAGTLDYDFFMQMIDTTASITGATYYSALLPAGDTSLTLQWGNAVTGGIAAIQESNIGNAVNFTIEGHYFV